MHVPLGSIQAIIVDMDGVLWRGAEELPGVKPFFEFLKSNSVHFLLGTNNATQPLEHYVERLGKMGVSISPGQVLTSADATAGWLSRELPAGSHVYAVGEEGLVQALIRSGFDVTNANAAAVVVGLDRSFTYEKLRQAADLVRSGSVFVATNVDRTLPDGTGLLPGAGSLVAAVQATTTVAPTIIGKPYPPMFEIALEILGSPRESTAMLGDRLDTDIEGARAQGLATLLVMTGVTTLEELKASPTKPDYVFGDLIELKTRWQASLH